MISLASDPGVLLATSNNRIERILLGVILLAVALRVWTMWRIRRRGDQEDDGDS